MRHLPSFFSETDFWVTGWWTEDGRRKLEKWVAVTRRWNRDQKLLLLQFDSWLLKSHASVVWSRIINSEKKRRHSSPYIIKELHLFDSYSHTHRQNFAMMYSTSTLHLPSYPRIHILTVTVQTLLQLANTTVNSCDNTKLHDSNYVNSGYCEKEK